MQFRFDSVKAAQAGAFLLKRNNASMDKYFFIKMLYIADRESLKKWDEPITGDSPVSMEYGPVLSTIYDLTKGLAMEHRPQWSPYISDADPDTNRVFLKADPGRDRLSNNELKLLEHVYERFKGFSWNRLKDHCHTFAEFEDVGKGSKPIPFHKIFSAVGKTPEQLLEIEKAERQTALMDSLMDA